MEPKPLPTRWSTLVFQGKASYFRGKRFLKDLANGPDRGQFTSKHTAKPVIAKSSSLLWMSDAPEEFRLQAGKIENLRRACQSLNGLEFGPNEVFSFWKEIGPPWKLNSYVEGRELREGCIIPSVGGGLCQLSNALYQAAIQANFEVIERHAHSAIVPGSLAELGQDATVFWNYIDLRFRSPLGFRIDISMDSQNLVVSFQGDPVAASEGISEPLTIASKSAESCESCSVFVCHKAIKFDEKTPVHNTAFLLDGYWPEFDTYIGENKKNSDYLFLPIDGRRLGKQNYFWTTSGFRKVFQSRWLVLKRSWVSRKMANQGAARQRALLDFDQQLVGSWVKRIPVDATHLVVSQNLLLPLWRSGALAGRTFDVLMTRYPFSQLQKLLDKGAKQFPESKTLADFRVPQADERDEEKIFRQARKIVTPHSGIADLFSGKMVQLPWILPDLKSVVPCSEKNQRIVFPCATVGRKGAYQMLAIAKELQMPLVVTGALIESAEFWRDVSWDKRPQNVGTLEQLAGEAAAVFIPAYVEHAPRQALAAVALGIPVIVSEECGMKHVDGVTTVRGHKAADYVAAFRTLIAAKRAKVVG